jgi:FkbM family methyltransferase
MKVSLRRIHGLLRGKKPQIDRRPIPSAPVVNVEAAPVRPIEKRPSNGYAAAGVLYSSKDLDAILRCGDFDIIIPTEEAGLLCYIARHGFENMEPDVRAVIKARVRQGDAAVDVGANIGLHALTLASIVGPSGSLTCFEPAPHIALALERSLRLNGFGDRAAVHRAAVADRSGQIRFHRAHHASVSSLFPLTDAMTAEEIQVPVTTLDDAFPMGSRVDFIKMDVEGAEPNIWRGMSRIVSENPELEIVLEWSSSHFRRSGWDPAAFMGEIGAAGFKPHLIIGRKGAQLTRPLSEDAGTLEGANLLLTRKDL